METTEDEPRVGAAQDGRRLRWLEHNQHRRAIIIEAAMRVLEQHEPGEEPHLQLIADAAGLSRTVIYRHFEDRNDLDRAVQRAVCERIGAAMLPALSVDGRPDEITRRIVDAFVKWASAHPSLFWFAERDLAGWGQSPLSEALERIAKDIEDIVQTVVVYLGSELSADDRAALDPWVFGLIGAVISATRRWLARPRREPDADTFVEVLAASVWFQVNGMATARGMSLPDLPVSELLQTLAPSDA